MIKGFISKIMATKKIASEKNVRFQWYNCIWHSLFIIFGVSLFLSIQTLVHVVGITGETPLNEIPVYLLVIPAFYTVVLTYFLLEKLIILNIIVFEKLNKQIFKLWQRMDMYWFKKYRKHSPFTEGLSKIQNKSSKFYSTKSKRQKKLIMVLIIAGLILFQFGLRIPTMIEQSQQEPTLNDETPTEQNDQLEEEIRIMVNGAG